MLSCFMPKTSLAFRTGSSIIESLAKLKGYYFLFYDAVKSLGMLKNAPVREVFYRQVYFSGIEAVGTVAVRGTLIGIVIITQVTAIVGMNAVLTGKILVWTVVRELGPLFAAIIIIARSSTAVAAELGSMNISGEVDHLRVMGISPLGYLIVPRVFGITLCVFILTFLFQIVTVAGGLLASSLILDIPFGHHLAGVTSALNLYELGVSLLKSVVFGLIISTVSCYHGLKVRSSITEIPQATTAAVMQSLLHVLVWDGIITFTTSQV